MSAFEIGGLVIELTGSHPVRTLVERELAPAMTTDESRVRIEVGGRTPDLRGAARSLGPVSVGDGCAIVHLRRQGLRIWLDWQDAARIEMSVEIGAVPHPVPDVVHRWVNPTFLRPSEVQAYLFILRVVEAATLWFGAGGLFHAAALERDGAALVITSAGGVGKTSSAAALLRREGWRYLSDDVLPFDAAGAVRSYPRAAMVYRYNTRVDPELRRRLLASRGLVDRSQWRLYEKLGVDRLRRRVAPGIVGAVPRGDEAFPIGLAVFLVRGSSQDVTSRPIEAEEFARRALAVSSIEFAELLDVVRLLEAAGAAPCATDDIVQRLSERYRSIAHDRAFEVVIGRSSGPDAVANHLADLFEA